MTTLHGIEFPDDEVQIAVIDGSPEWVVNRKGARRLADHAPNREAAARFLAWLASVPGRADAGAP